MRWVFAFLLAMVGCVRPDVMVPTLVVRGPVELPPIEPLGIDPSPTPPEDLFIELAHPAGTYAAAIMPDGSARYRIPGAQGCAGGLDREAIGRIVGLVDRTDFWSFKDLYPGEGRAAYGYRITVHARGKTKSVLHWASEHAAVVHGDLKGIPDIGDRLRLAALEDVLEKALHFDSITYVRSIDLVHTGPDATVAFNKMRDALYGVRQHCGGFEATAVQLAVRGDGTVTSTAAIPGGAIAGCPEEVLREIVFPPTCSAANVLYVVEGEGLHAEVHSITPTE